MEDTSTSPIWTPPDPGSNPPAAPPMPPEALWAEAFFEDPFMSAVFPDPRRRRARLRVLFAATARHALRAGGGLVRTADAAALWLPLRRWSMGLGDLARAGMLGFPLRFGRRSLGRLTRHEDHCERAVSRLGLEDAGYVWLVGVRDGARGRGHGADVLRRVVAEVGAAHRAVVLKTDNPANVAFYRRAGLDLVHHEETPPSGHPFWVFARSTRP